MIYAVEAFRVLFANKLRSLLTMLGLIVGVGSVVAIAVLGSGMAGGVGGLLGGMSDESFIVFPNQQQQDLPAAEFRLSDLPGLRAAIPQLADAVPLAFVTDLISSGHHRGRYRLSPESAVPFTNLPLLYGRHIDQNDIDTAAHVAVLQHDAYLKLYPRRRRSDGRQRVCRPQSFRRGRASYKHPGAGSSTPVSPDRWLSRGRRSFNATFAATGSLPHASSCATPATSQPQRRP